MSLEVLVVDDEPAVCQTISRWLTQDGLQCHVANSAQEALKIAAVEMPLLSITDVRMPDNDGIWLLEQYKERWPDMAVLMLTGVSEARTAIECLRIGADDYLIKPVDMEELTIAARRALERHRLIAENKNYQVNLEKMVQERTVQLDKALQVIEGTYQSTLQVLVGARNLSPLKPNRPKARPYPLPGTLGSKSGDVREDRPSSCPTSLRTETCSSPRKLDEESADRMFELAAFRSAGEFVCKSSSVSDLAEDIAVKLVEGAGAQSVRFLLKSKRSPEMELVIEKGDSFPEEPSILEEPIAGAITKVHTRGEQLLAGVPIEVRGQVKGLLQISWKQGTGNPLPLAERLSLFLALSIAREVDAAEWQKTSNELDIFYGLASATRYTLDIHHVTQFIMESLHKVVAYDVAGLLLVEEPALLKVQSRFALSNEFVSRVRSQILNSFRLTCGIEVRDDMEVQFNRIETYRAETSEPPEKLRSFINVPLTIEGGVIGQIHISSGKDNAFTQEEVLFLNRIASFLASAVQGVRDILATVKGRIERMVDHMSDGVVMLDDRGEIVALNEAAQRILKLNASASGSFPSTQLAEILGFEPLSLLQEERRRIRKVVLIHEIPYQFQLSPIEHLPGEMSGAVVAFRDFTEEKKIDEMKSEFINIVSHELRTPLTAMKNAVDLLLSPRLGDLNQNQERFLRLAQRNINQLRDLINDLLDVSKIEAGKMRVALQRLHLAEPIDVVVDSLMPQAKEKGVRLETDVASDLPFIYGESNLIERVLVNLIGNALKFTDRGGRICVEAHTVSDHDNNIRRPYLEVAIRDTGVGIPKEQLETIFDKFHQVGQDHDLKATGTGLGLPICRALVRAHHGRIWAESKVGEGSRFVVRLPVLTDEEIFFRGLEPDIDRARRLPAPLSLVVVRLDNPRMIHDQLGSERYESLLECVAKGMHETLRRSTDRMELRKAKAEFMVILLDTTRDGGLAYGRRLLERLSTEQALSHPKVQLTYGCAVFPEEAATAEKLYQIAVERAIRRETPDDRLCNVEGSLAYANSASLGSAPALIEQQPGEKE